ncbi:MAG TPA: hypothetical protein DCM23_00650 [Firmicutes bacterium]|jgi:ribosomal-protein-alanine N-acetyltransferase|nr:hypothetical protein [Bacillota bacterium]HAV20248.1 hypothetical protein [Bacillota bacterium]
MIYETKRLIIRKAVQGDLQAVHAVANDPNVLKFNCYEPGTIEDTIRYIQKTAEDERRYVIEHKELHYVIGEINFEHDSLRYGVNSVLLSYQLETSFTGKGYMSETLRGALKYCFDVRNAEMVVARVFADNERSNRLLKHLGFTLEGTLKHAVKGYGNVIHDDNLYCMMKEEYLLKETFKK